MMPEISPRVVWAIAVDTRRATISLRSGHFMRLDGAPVSTERNPVMGVYPAKHGR
jgi:hypothetical protein